MSPYSVPNLVRMITQYRLLKPVLLEGLTQDLQAKFSDPQLLADELVQRRWLTPYQVEQLLQGQGQNLLLGHYILLEPVRKGGMGQIFKARHEHMNRVVALKFIHKERLASPDAVRRSHREIRALGQLSHPNIVLAYDADQIGDLYFLVMEYVEGISLDRVVGQSGPLPVLEACDYIRQAALGLQYIHDHRLLHRDIKPANLLVTAQRRWCLN